MKHSDVCTHLNNEEDVDILTRKLFDVNMRLFTTSPTYNDIVCRAAYYIRFLATNKLKGYSKPYGFSGANAGIPFNIIALRNGLIMLNPVITDRSEELIETSTNCGSLTLTSPIKKMRHKWVSITFFTINGTKVIKEKLHKEDGGFTIQHEIEHNLGRLITT